MAQGAASTTEVSDFEKERLKNITERDALLKKLTREAQELGLRTRAPPRAATNGAGRSQKRNGPPARRVKKEEDITPRRTSSRLAGIQADSEVAKRKADDEYVAAKEAARVKRQRVSGDLSLDEIAVHGKSWKGLLGTDAILKGVAKPYERTFGDDEIKETSDKDLRSLRQKMNRMELWDAWEPTRIKITPERIYSMSFHPTTSKPLIFAGDKLGHLGILDASQKSPQQTQNDVNVKIKAEPKPSTIHSNPGGPDPADSDDEDDPDPTMTTIKPHTRTISAMYTHPSAPQTLYTASYDSSIRALDLEKSVATEVYGPQDPSEDEPLSGVDMAASDPNVLYFTTLSGVFGRHDIRQSSAATELYPLSEKKIGGFSLHPLAPHYLATASLDRFMRLWDLRKITKKLPTLVGEHESRLSVSHAAFNTAGQVATSSYDDSIKIHSFGVGGRGGTQSIEAMNDWEAGFRLEEEVMKPEVVVRHNCQTGRWVTM